MNLSEFAVIASGDANNNIPVKVSVRISRDGSPFVIDDATVDNTTKGEGFVSYHSDPELSVLGIQRLDDFLLSRMRSGPGAPLVVLELKATQSAFAVGTELTRFFNNGMLNKRDVIVSSFIFSEIAHFRKLMPDVPAALCIQGVPHDYARAVANLDADALFVSAEFVERTMVDEAKHYGAKVFVQGVNNPKHIARLRAMKVDGVVTDSPTAISKLVNGLSSSAEIERTLRECA